MSSETINTFRDLINSKAIGEEITRSEYINYHLKNCGLRKLNSMCLDTIKYKLVILGYLSTTPNKGKFNVLKHLPDNFNISEAMRKYKTNTVRSRLGEQVGGSNYLQMPTQPIEIIARLRMSYIQGCIVKYLSRYKTRDGLKDLQKAYHYIDLAIPFGETVPISANYVGTLNQFIRDNKIVHIAGLVMYYAAVCNWEKAKINCRALIQAEYGIELE